VADSLAGRTTGERFWTAFRESEWTVLKALIKRAVISAGLEGAALLKGAGVMAGARGRGAIFTLHHVRPFARRAVDPNRHLEITPEFLDAALARLTADGYRFVALDAVPALLAAGDGGQPFAAFTLDDGYRNNLSEALPVFERHGAPFTVFVCEGFSRRSHTIWWETAAALINAGDAFEYDAGAGLRRFSTRNSAERMAAFGALATAITGGGSETDAITRLDAAASSMGVDARAMVEALVMPDEQLRQLAAHPLASLGAHTISHRALSLLDDATVAAELRQSADYVEGVCGRRPTTLAYPYGDGRSVSARTVGIAEGQGFALAVTTAPGTLNAAHAGALWQLPRISLNGHFQTPRAVTALASGIPFKLLKG